MAEKIYFYCFVSGTKPTSAGIKTMVSRTKSTTLTWMRPPSKYFFFLFLKIGQRLYELEMLLKIWLGMKSFLPNLYNTFNLPYILNYAIFRAILRAAGLQPEQMTEKDIRFARKFVTKNIDKYEPIDHLAAPSGRDRDRQAAWVDSVYFNRAIIKLERICCKFLWILMDFIEF